PPMSSCPISNLPDPLPCGFFMVRLGGCQGEMQLGVFSPKARLRQEKSQDIQWRKNAKACLSRGKAAHRGSFLDPASRRGKLGLAPSEEGEIGAPGSHRARSGAFLCTLPVVWLRGRSQGCPFFS